MAAAVRGPPAQSGSWTSGCRLVGLQNTDTPVLGPVQPTHGGALPLPVPFGGVPGGLPSNDSPLFHSVALRSVGSSSPKTLEQPTIAPGFLMGEVPIQADPTEGAPVEPWMVLAQQQVQQQCFYEGQPVAQQQMQQQRPQGPARGPNGGDGPPVGLGDSSQWASSMESATDGSGGFGYGSSCMLSSQAPTPFGVSLLPTGPYLGEPLITTQPHLPTWQPGAGGQQDTIQGPFDTGVAFGMCMSTSPGQTGGGGEAPESQANVGGGPWYAMQQQPIGGLEASSASYPALSEGSSAPPKAEGKSSRQNKNGGSRRRGDLAADSGAPGGVQAATRPAKFFKQHSPAKAAPKPRGKMAASQQGPLGEGGTKGPGDGAVGCTGPPSQAAVGALTAGQKTSPGPVAGSQGDGAVPKAAPRSRAVRPSEVMAKMYFHRKKEAWRAELLIEGTKKQKSFSCRVGQAVPTMFLISSLRHTTQRLLWWLCRW